MRYAGTVGGATGTAEALRKDNGREVTEDRKTVDTPIRKMQGMTFVLHGILRVGPRVDLSSKGPRRAILLQQVSGAVLVSRRAPAQIAQPKFQNRLD